MKDPLTNKILSKRNEIKEAALDYCADLLENRKAKERFEDDVLMKNIIHNIRMEEIIENETKFTPEMFDHSLEILKKKNKDKYKFILKGGRDLKLALFKLFNMVWCSEQKPDQWRRTEIIQLYKGKG